MRQNPAEDDAVQVDLWGEEHHPFQTALKRYGVWPTTVWEVRHSDPYTRELKALISDDGELRQGSSRGGGGVYSENVGDASIFSPAVAAYLLNLYGQRGQVVYDPFAGGGTRAIMAAAAGMRYQGVELRPAEVEAVARRIAHAGVEGATVIQGDAQAPPEAWSATSDLLLTCPPYWDWEMYDGGANDLSMAPTYERFLDMIAASAEAAHRVLKPGALSCWVVGIFRSKDRVLRPFHHDLTAIHGLVGYRLREEIILHHVGNGSLRRIGNFDKGSHRLIRQHEYAMVYERI